MPGLVSPRAAFVNRPQPWSLRLAVFRPYLRLSCAIAPQRLESCPTENECMLGDTVGTSGRARYAALVVGLALYFAGRIGALADPPAGTEAGAAPQSLPQDGFFSSLKQSIKQGYDREAVRGHFDVGSPPNVR